MQGRDSRIVTWSIVIFFIILLGYALYEAQAMLWGPRITVPSDTVIVREPFASIQGKAENIAELRLNGVPVSVTEEGLVDEPYSLSQGENRLVFDAHDNYGRTTQKVVQVMYIPHESGATSP